MDRWRAAAVGAATLGLAGGVSLLTPVAAGASGVSVRVTPSSGLVNGEIVTVSGHGLTRTQDGKPQTWFVAECTASVQGRMNPSTDTPHCDIADAKAIRLGRHGTFSARFRVENGIIGDGYCGSDGHGWCVVGVGDARGQGTVARISFKAPPPATTTTMAPASSTTSSTG